MTTLVDVEAVLREYYISSGLPRIGTNYRLEDTVELAARVGNPQDQLRVIHVAGTSGKTTTTYYAAALLRESGARVGWTVSPHVTSVLERAQIGHGVLDERQFVAYFAEFLPLATVDYTVQPSFFELMAVFALWVFAREGVDYAVIETGMGGTYDSTNICRRSDKLCVITDIGLDHVQILGKTIGEIAEQKAGIIADGNVVCMYEQSAEVMTPVRAAITAHNAQLVLATSDDGGTYFDRNFHLAETVYTTLAQRDGLPQLTDAQRQAARAMSIPGRLEKLAVGSTTFVLDGAHNEQKMRTMLDTFDHVYGTAPVHAVVALKHDKDIAAVASLLAARAASMVATEYAVSQDMPILPTPAAELAAKLGGEAAIEPRLERALAQVIDSNVPLVLVTGSFYAVSEARSWLIAAGAAATESGTI